MQIEALNITRKGKARGAPDLLPPCGMALMIIAGEARCKNSKLSRFRRILPDLSRSSRLDLSQDVRRALGIAACVGGMPEV